MNAGSPNNADGVTPTPDAQEAAFLEVLAHRSMLKGYLMVIVRDPHLAEDCLSDVTLVIARGWSKFDRTKPFAPWARGIARRVALANMRKWKKPEVLLDEDMIESLGEELSGMGDEGELEENKQKLQNCLKKLPERSRELITLRYFKEASYEQIAEQTGRTLSALYMAFSRIHEGLGRCLKNVKETL
jgi:RNA polymerase sigma-70 factor (ECF subfamily)